MANVADLLRAAAGADGGRPALVGPATAVTWGELDADVDALAGGLRAADLRLGDRVGLLLRSPAHFVPAYLAVLRAGLIAVPVDLHSSGPEVGRALIDSAARLLVVDGPTRTVGNEGVQIAAAAGFGVRLVDADADGADGLATLRSAGAHRDAAATPGGEAVAVLLETAGSGGRPKRAMLSHRALLANLDQCAALDPAPVTAEDRVLLVLPLSGVFGVSTVLGQVLRAGATMVLAGELAPAALLAQVASAGVTSVAGPPALFLAWAALPEARESLAGLRVLVSGSAPLRAETATAFAAGTGRRLGQGYGLTEAAGVVAADISGAKPGSVGKALPGIAVRLLDGGREVDEGDPGEVWVRGKNLFSGYWPDGHGGPDVDGWFGTGDLAWADADGALFMVSQRADVIVVSGFTVYPGEVEDVLSSHPSVQEAAVVAVADELTGAAVKALVVTAQGTVPDVEELRAWCATRLSRFKVPRRIEVVEALPHSSAGSVARGRLRPTVEDS